MDKAEAERAFFVRQEQQTSLGARQLDGRVHQRGQHLLQCWSAMQHLRHLKQQVQMVQLWRRTFCRLTNLLQKARQNRLFRDESYLVGVGDSKTNLVSTFEKAGVLDPVAVDKRAVSAVTVLNPKTLRCVENLSMAARNAVIEQHEIVITLAPQGKDGAGNLHVAVNSRSVLTNQKMGKRVSHIVNSKLKNASSGLPPSISRIQIAILQRVTEGLNWCSKCSLSHRRCAASGQKRHSNY